jgi:hypothetical protein
VFDLDQQVDVISNNVPQIVKNDLIYAINHEEFVLDLMFLFVANANQTWQGLFSLAKRANNCGVLRAKESFLPSSSSRWKKVTEASNCCRVVSYSISSREEGN